MKINSKYVTTIKVIDPDSKLEVNVQILKMETGGLVGIDESFLANTDESIYSPYDVGVEINIED